MRAEKVNRTSRQRLLKDLSSVVEAIEEVDVPEHPRTRNLMREKLRERARRLSQAIDRFDPILKPTGVFDPTDPRAAGRVIALTAVAQPRHPLASVRPFYGAGIYALYYNGSFPPYAQLSRTEQPIYVGKADPKDPRSSDPTSQGTGLSDRLSDHVKSINQASTTLRIDDFDCRFLIVKSGLQKSAEEYLINFFKPIWNSEVKICFGVGKHGDSPDVRLNKRSPRDTLHPGRAWADRLEEEQKSRGRIVQAISEHLNRNPPQASTDELLYQLIDELRQLAPSDFRDATGRSTAVELPTPRPSADVVDQAEPLF